MNINRYQIIALIIMSMFYAAYLGKMISQKKKGIQTDQMARGKSDKKRLRTEIVMKAATYSIIPVELFSILSGHSVLRYSGKSIGIILSVAGVLLFTAAVITMADSWRAGIAEEDATAMIRSGIYKISRNPAFMGFDLIYIGILLIFFNWLLVIFTAWAMIMLHLQILQEERFLLTVFGDEYINYKKKVCRYFGRKSWKFFVPFVAAVVCLFAGYTACGMLRMSTLPNLSFADMLAYTAGNNPDAVITVGIIRDGEATYKVYGENSRELLHTYEIGSLTKTITAACLSQAVLDGNIVLTDGVDLYLDLPEGNEYPTIAELLTHTSGYQGYYFETPMIMNYLTDRNIYYGITEKMIINRAVPVASSDTDYAFNYSNYGYAMLGLILEKVYDGEYHDIINNFIRNELNLKNTAFTIEPGDLGNYWTWSYEDAYASAGAITSDIEDMLAYAQIQLDENGWMAATHKSLKTIDVSSDNLQSMGIYMNEIGMAWVIDNENGFIWHNGATGDYNCYLGFCADTQTAVVILSNLPSDYRIPATVMGVRLLKEIQK